MQFNIKWNQGLVAIFFICTVLPMTAVALWGFQFITDIETVDLTLQWLVQIWVIALIPITFYIAFFTKFNNPFKKVEEEK